MTPSETIHFNRYTFILGVLLTVISCLIFYSFGNQKPSFLKSLDNQITDMMYKTRGPIPDSGQVLIVDIDEKSLHQFGQWPWPRNILAQLTDRLFQNGAQVVGFDIVFAEQDRSSPMHYFKNLTPAVRHKIPQDILTALVENPDLDYDALFAQALSNGPSVLGYAFQMKKDTLKSEENQPFPSSIIRVKPDTVNFDNLSLIPAYRAVINHPSVAMAQSEGFFNVFEDRSGTTRNVPLMMKMDGIPYPSLALEIYRLGTGSQQITIQVSPKIKTPKAAILGIHVGNRFFRTDSFCQLFVNFRGPVNTFHYISAADVLTRESLPDVKGKFVIVGSSATGLFDLKTSPLSNIIPGTEINANIIDNLIKNDPFVYDIYTEIGLTYTLIIAGGLFVSLLLSLTGPLAGSLGAILFLLSVMAGNYYFFFLKNQHMGVTYPLLTCFSIVFSVSILNAFRERKNKRFIQKAFSHYVNPGVVQHLIQHPDQLSLKGEERELTVLFLDIRGFTSIAEKMNSRELGNFMNIFLTRMSRIIMNNSGTVDKFIGDAIMAFWGAPAKDPDHVFHAVNAALLLKNEIEQMQDKFKQDNLPQIRIGIGINSGMMSVGNFGSKDRFDYTVMGDNVNLGSRLEGANKNYGTTILISESTWELVKDRIYCCYVDKIIVKGRQQPVDIYEPLINGTPPESTVKETELFEKGVAAFQNMEFEQAKDCIQKLFDSNPRQLYDSYLTRIDGFLKTPPPEGWNGAERRTFLPVNKLLTK